MVEITFKVKKPGSWDWLKDEYFKRFEKNQEFRERVSEFVLRQIRDTIKELEEPEEGEEPGEEYEEAGEEEE